MIKPYHIPKQIFQIWYIYIPVSPTTRTLYLCWQRHNSPAAIARELFEPSMDAAGHLFSIKEFFLI